jgi:hypothetical protein
VQKDKPVAHMPHVQATPSATDENVASSLLPSKSKYRLPDFASNDLRSIAKADSALIELGIPVAALISQTIGIDSFCGGSNTEAYLRSGRANNYVADACSRVTSPLAKPKIISRIQGTSKIDPNLV